jgi:hypothetical protein
MILTFTVHGKMILLTYTVLLMGCPTGKMKILPSCICPVYQITPHHLVSANARSIGSYTLKIDFEKAYDKVRWPFLMQTLRMKGFSPK